MSAAPNPSRCRPDGLDGVRNRHTLSLDCAVAIARQRDNGAYEEWQRSRARQLTGYLLDCRAGLGEWEDAQPEPLPGSDGTGHQAEPDGPVVFYFGETPLNVIIQDGEPWFVAKEVCDALGIVNSRDATSVLDEDEKADVGLTDTSSNGVTQQRSVTIISDSGFYTLALRCRDATKPGTTAYEFRRWVTKEVLPSIRKTGRYRHPAQGNIVQPGPANLPVETLPTPSFTDRQEKIAAKPAKAKAGRPKVANTAKPDPAKPANGKGQK